MLNCRIDELFLGSYIPPMAWDVEYTDEFGEWWDTLVSGSKHPHMRELRVQHKGKPLRILYAFDPRRTAILLFGGDKTGNDRWYESAIPRADRLYEAHVRTVGRKGR